MMTPVAEAPVSSGSWNRPLGGSRAGGRRLSSTPQVSQARGIRTSLGGTQVCTRPICHYRGAGGCKGAEGGSKGQLGF